MKTIVPLLAASLLLAGCCSQKTPQPIQSHSPTLNGFQPHMAGPHRWTSQEPAARGSVENRLRSAGKHWKRVPGKITAGAYVQDILEGRFDQPVGRGAIGKVESVLTGDRGQAVAKVNFGRNYAVNINFSELSLVEIY